MTAGGAVRIRPAPVLDEKQRQSLGRVGEVLVGIDRTQDRVGGDARVEALDESPECRRPTHRLEYGHGDDDRGPERTRDDRRSGGQAVAGGLTPAPSSSSSTGRTIAWAAFRPVAARYFSMIRLPTA